MKQIVMCLLVAAILVGGLASVYAQVDKAIIIREKASVEAWQKKDKAFYMDLYTDDGTYFGPRSPYLETEPKANFLPKLDKYFDEFKILDFQMYNPRVQVYGDDTAILTYNEAVTASFGGKTIDYTGKVTSVYVKQGNA